MSNPTSETMEFLLNRRSRPAKTLTTPVPGRDALHPILTAAARVPDHGKLEPWRFLVLEREALQRLATEVEAAGERLEISAEKIAKTAAQYSDAHLAVMVIASPKQSSKIPQIEQTLSAGAVCLSLVNAALASGWGACWLTGWITEDPIFCENTLGLSADEWIAGIIHIGTETSTPPERPRPDIEEITTWVTE